MVSFYSHRFIFLILTLHSTVYSYSIFTFDIYGFIDADVAANLIYTGKYRGSKRKDKMKKVKFFFVFFHLCFYLVFILV